MTDNFDPDREDFDPKPDEHFSEPDETRVHEQEVMEEWAADATPDEWWQNELNSAYDEAVLTRAVEKLVAKGCVRVDLLLELRALKNSY